MTTIQMLDGALALITFACAVYCAVNVFLLKRRLEAGSKPSTSTFVPAAPSWTPSDLEALAPEAEDEPYEPGMSDPQWAAMHDAAQEIERRIRLQNMPENLQDDVFPPPSKGRFDVDAMQAATPQERGLFDAFSGEAETYETAPEAEDDPMRAPSAARDRR